MRILFTVLIMVSITVTVTAQISITGSIKNKAGIGVSGADITLVNRSNVSAKSDADGSFSISAASSIRSNNPLSLPGNAFEVNNSTIKFTSHLAEKSIQIRSVPVMTSITGGPNHTRRDSS